MLLCLPVNEVIDDTRKKSFEPLKLAFVAGKSGGHIVPCFTLAEIYATQQQRDIKMLFLSGTSALDNKIIGQNKRIEYATQLSFTAMPRTMWSWFAAGFYFCDSFVRSCINFIRYAPSRLITTGGIIAIPAILAASFLSIPVDLYVLDAVPGKALLAVEAFADTIYCCFDSAKAYFSHKNIYLVDYPVRYTEEQKNISIANARQVLGLDQHKKTILVLGGSQGSSFLNQLMLNCAKNSHFASSVQIIHQYGNDSNDFKKEYQDAFVQAITFDYAADLALYYAAADLVVARAGAGTIFETLSFKKKMILIPLETNSTSHQVDNAYAISNRYPDKCFVILQKSIVSDPQIFYDAVNMLL